MQDALKARLVNAAWNLKMFERANYDPAYNYLVGMAHADVRVALDIMAELETDVP